MADPLLPVDPPDPAPTLDAPTTRQKTITCEFCRCRLTPSGDYLALSDEAKAFRGQSERIGILKADLDTARADIDLLRKQLDEAYAQVKEAQDALSQPRGLW